MKKSKINNAVMILLFVLGLSPTVLSGCSNTKNQRAVYTTQSQNQDQTINSTEDSASTSNPVDATSSATKIR